MNWFITGLVIVFIPLLCLYCYQRGKEKRAGILIVILIMIFTTPFIGYFIVEALPGHKKPCKWCGNKNNEAFFCGICGKNEDGELRPDLIKSH